MAFFQDDICSFKRVSHNGASAVLTASSFVLSAGFGSTASITSVTGSESLFVLSVQSAGTGQGANPTATLTFPGGVWRNEMTGATYSPIAIAVRNGGSQPTVPFTWASTPTTLTLTLAGTPVAAESYVVVVRVSG